ncbi:MAG: hypothetical protein L3J69_10340 [Desulfobacula sp.]|nr:hypothetical protein [Desulfobacula sp.]
MFWKKKIAVNETINHPSEDKRESYRYQFAEGQGFSIYFKEKKIKVLNISAGGIAFENKGFLQFDFDFIKFKLNIPNFSGDSTFFAGLRILKIDKSQICHCILEQCPLEQHELIHKFVLEKQKNDLAH